MPRKNKRRRRSSRTPGRVGGHVGDRIISGLTELRDALRAGVPLEQRFTVRMVEIDEPEQFDPARVRTLRARLKVSQAVFAKLLGVSTVLAQSWEQGARAPSTLARRLLAEVERDPRRWQRMIMTTHAPVASRKRSA
jgi:putative transcriptional regulator